MSVFSYVLMAVVCVLSISAIVLFTICKIKEKKQKKLNDVFVDIVENKQDD